jgi:hypothetical protein
MEFKIEKCKTRAAYSAKLLGKAKLNLDSIKRRFKVVADTPILLVIDVNGEIIVHDYGELIFKMPYDKEKINEVAKKIFDAGLK